MTQEAATEFIQSQLKSSDEAVKELLDAANKLSKDGVITKDMLSSALTKVGMNEDEVAELATIARVNEDGNMKAEG